MGFSEEKIFKFGFYCLNALICIYSLYMFVIQKGNWCGRQQHTSHYGENCVALRGQRANHA